MEADSHSDESQTVFKVIPSKFPFFLLTFSIIYSIMFTPEDKSVSMLIFWPQ